MAYPVSQSLKEALVAPKRDVLMRVTAVQHVDYYYRVVERDTSLKGYWRMGDTNATVSDSSGNSRTGSYSGGYTQSQNPGIINDPLANKAVKFNGTTGYATITTHTSLHPGDTLTIELWFKRSTIGVAQTLVSAGANDYQVRFASNNKLYLTKQGVSDVWASLDGLADTLWHHLVISKATSFTNVYLDGAILPGQLTNQTLVAATTDINLARKSDGTELFDGWLDEVAVYSTAFTSERAYEHYAAGVGPGITDITNITAPVAEGIVYVDVERATRRTAQIRIINRDGAYTPLGPDYTTLGTNALFWWDKYFRLEYGVLVGDHYEYVPLGIFMIDRVEILAEKGASVINIDGSDIWKKFTFSTFSRPKAYFVNTEYNDIITDLAREAGVARLNLADLSGRATAEHQLQAPVYFEMDDNRGERLWDLCTSWGLSIYFDVSGTLTTEDARATAMVVSPPVWTFDSGEEAVFISITKAKSGDAIYNHYVVTGEVDGNALVMGERIDGIGTDASGSGWSTKYTNNVASPTRIERIGDRVTHIRSTTVLTSTAAQALADAAFLKGTAIEEDITLPSIVVPHLEGGDVIQIIESALTKTNGRYQVKQFDIPMRGNQQEIHTTKMTQY